MITASMVKELREITSAPMLDCKKALEASSGNIEGAIDWLREKGISKAAKKASRIAAEGLAMAKVSGNIGVIVEVNSETDFVAKNDEFKSLISNIVDVIIENNVTNLDEVNALTINGQTISDLIVAKTATIGEKLSLRRFKRIVKDDTQTFGLYSHMGGKIVSLVVIDGDKADVAKDIAMHASAMRPAYLAKSDVPADAIEREKNILMEQAQNEGLDEKKIPMIVNGRLNKFYDEICLEEQNFIKENKMKVSKYVADKNSKIISFVRYEVGEGMEKKEENFAEEVKKQMK